MKVLIIGSGSKEHAIAWKLLLAENSLEHEIVCIPGNDALSKLVECVSDIDINDVDRLLEIAIARHINLTIVGEGALFEKGIVNKFRLAGKNILGPSTEAAQIEWSNAFLRELCYEKNIPSPKFACFENIELAKVYIQTAKFPCVIRCDKKFSKAETLFYLENNEQAQKVLGDLGKDGFLSHKKPKVIIEEYIKGQEFTINTLCDGNKALSLLPVQAYRDIEISGFQTDLGAYAPTPIISDSLMQEIRLEIIDPVVDCLKSLNRNYTGMMAFDIVLDSNDALKAKLIQVRTTIADSDAQVVFPLLDEDLFDIAMATAKADLSSFKDGFHKYAGSALAVNITANEGVDTDLINTNDLVKNLDSELEKFQGTLNGIPLIFYGKKPQSQVFGATGVAETLVDAQILAYKLAESIEIPSKTYEKNIGDHGMI